MVTPKIDWVGVGGISDPTPPSPPSAARQKSDAVTDDPNIYPQPPAQCSGGNSLFKPENQPDNYSSILTNTIDLAYNYLNSNRGYDYQESIIRAVLNWSKNDPKLIAPLLRDLFQAFNIPNRFYEGFVFNLIFRLQFNFTNWVRIDSNSMTHMFTTAYDAEQFVRTVIAADLDITGSLTPEIINYVKTLIGGKYSGVPAIIQLLESYRSIAEDKKIVYEAASECDQYFMWLLTQENVSLETVLSCLSVDGRLLRYVSDEMKKDPRVIETALKNDPTAIYFMHPSERYNPKWLPFIEDDPRTAHIAADALPQWITMANSHLSSDDLQQMFAMRADLENAVRANPEHPMHPEGKVKLIISHKSDHNGAFQTINTVKDAIANGETIVLYEIANERQYLSVLNYYLPLLRAGDVVVETGHGTKTSKALTENGEARLNHEHLFYDKMMKRISGDGEEYIIDTGDREQFMAYIPEERIPEGVYLYSVSCSNAEGGPDDPNNLMNMQYDVMRKKWHVFAHEAPGHGAPPTDSDKPKALNTRIYHLLPHNDGVEIIEPNIYGFSDLVEIHDASDFLKWLGFFLGDLQRSTSE